ncbi:hypothetical protein [Candidatus Viridilinea mediisalina]|uniref:DUF2029 domain-containing protein n=1 Tax=Candidatus Viridilinea mediisalina TaxID=2024553 RepID=A0A2A6RF49_9CHLR|nr:hypothetical protein [Candidatus Viridilinea mediisalina]PDW01516.1 hypothetical protein CJ255_18785 [Candidatus Viridilinea mediisalina]
MHRFPPRSRQILIALSIALSMSISCVMLHPQADQSLADLGWPINAARDLLNQRDPYRHPTSPTMIPYPLTSAIVVFPWALLPGNLGISLLFGAASGLLAYGLIRNGEYWRLLVFLSPAYFASFRFLQWPPIFMAIYFFPLLAPMLLAKPTLALPVALAIRWTPGRIAGLLTVGLLSLLVMPTWPWRWLSQTGSYGGFIPILSLLGPCFLITALFWRNLQARIFFLLTITPQHRFFYDQLLLWMIPQTRNQMLLLTITAWLGFGYVWQSGLSFWDSAPYILGLIYLPALLIVLWQQPAIQRVYHYLLHHTKRA